MVKNIKVIELEMYSRWRDNTKGLSESPVFQSEEGQEESPSFLLIVSKYFSAAKNSNPQIIQYDLTVFVLLVFLVSFIFIIA